jgi:DNA polymerase-3 subunit delta'
MSLHRDVLLHQLGADLPQVNEAIAPRIAEAAEAGSAAASLAVLDAVGVARRRIDGNVSPALALEAMLVSVTRTRPAGRA